MASRIISLSAMNNFFRDDLKCIQRGENSLNSGHLIECHVTNNVVKGVVAASMRNKNYDVEVNNIISKVFETSKSIYSILFVLGVACRRLDFQCIL